MEKPEQFLFQLEAPLPGRRKEAPPQELAGQTEALRGVAAWAAGVQSSA